MTRNQLQDDDLVELHDAELSDITMDRAAGTIILRFRSEDGPRCYELLFENAWQYRIDNIQTQNVVSRILTSDTELGFKGDLQQVLRWTCSGSENRLLMTEEKFAGILTRVRSGDARLFYVDPSCGAEIGVISQAVILTIGMA